jgi:hypothetical protein
MCLIVWLYGSVCSCRLVVFWGLFLRDRCWLHGQAGPFAQLSALVAAPIGIDAAMRLARRQVYKWSSTSRWPPGAPGFILRSPRSTPEERAAKAAKAQPDPALLANVVQLSRKPVEPITPLTAEEFRALLDQLDPKGYAEIAAMVESFVDKNAN